MAVTTLHFVNSSGLEQLESLTQIAWVAFLHLGHFSKKSLLLEVLGYLLLIWVTSDKILCATDLLTTFCVAFLLHNILPRKLYLSHLLVVEVKQLNTLLLGDPIQGNPISEVVIRPSFQGLLRVQINRSAIALCLALDLVFRRHQETVHTLAEGWLPLVNRTIKTRALLHLSEVCWVDRPKLFLALVA